jgi:PAS domain S-box-containing protein
MQEPPGDVLADSQRLAALRRTALMDAPASAAFDRLTRLAARVLKAPVALVSLVDQDRQFFSSCLGLPEPWATARGTPLSHSFCQHVVRTATPVVITDARKDPRVRENLAIRDLDVIAYAGIPLTTPDGLVLGSFCVIDHEPREWQPEEIEILEDLAGAAATEVAMRLDMVERQDAEHALRGSEARKAAILSSALDGIVTIDEAGLIVEFNPAAERIFGYPLDAVLGRPMADLIIPLRYRQAHYDGLARYRATGERRVLGRRIELAAIRADGEEFPVELAISPIAGEHGSRLFTSTIRDITDRRRAEEELLAARRAAEESAEAKRQFLATMSHEIRTPLNGVIGLAHLLGSTELDEQQREFVRTLRLSGETLLSLINDILDFSKIDAGHVEFEQIPFDLPRLLEDLLATLRYSADEKGLELRSQLASDLPVAVVGDRARLRQILLNLVANAIKFTEFGNVRVDVDSRRSEDHRLMVRFRVSDTGMGIDSGRLKAVFEPFVQEGPEISTRFGGTGLGLAIVRRLTELQGGRVAVESTPGRGSRFTVELPLGIAESEGREAPLAAGATGYDLEGVRVLVAEDNEVNQLITRLLLEKAGARVEMVGDGAAAVRHLAADPDFDIVLMDLQMPEMDGIEATLLIRNDLGLADTRLPIVALTASALVEDRERAFRSGMDGLIVKPVDPTTFASLVAAALTRARTGASDAPPANGAGEPLLAAGTLDRSVLGQPEFAVEVIELFLRQLPEGVAAMRESIRTRKVDPARDAAHRLKSSAALLGALPLARVLEEVERSAAEADLEKLGEALDRLGELLGPTTAALERARAGYAKT